MRSFTYHFDTEEERLTYRYDAEEDVSHDNSLPDWTRLEFHQCEGCQWYKTDRCPVAVKLTEPAQLLGKFTSFDAINVTVEAPERVYFKQTTVQEGLSSLFGLIIATSGCPTFRYHKGLAWYHLPFATYEETLFRSISGYLIQNYLLKNQPGPEELLEEIRGIYDQVKLTNLGISQRLREGVAPQTDSPMNALVILDSFGALVPMSLEMGMRDMEDIFLSKV